MRRLAGAAPVLLVACQAASCLANGGGGPTCRGPAGARRLGEGNTVELHLLQTSVDLAAPEGDAALDVDESPELTAWASQESALYAYPVEMRRLANWFRGGPRGQRLVAAAGLLQAPAVRLSLGGGACGAGRTGEVDCASSGRGSLPATAGNIASAVLAGSLVLFVLASTGDFKQFSQMLTGEHGRAAPRKGCAHLVHCGFAAGPPDASGGGARGARRPPARPIAAIMGLTVYRFYTGFLSATWLPYLLAMEGVDLWGENQALFMGIIKLLYGASILLNPLFGLLGDKAATMSHGLGRRIFVRAGILLAALGIFTCYFAASRGLFRVFLLGILAWRLGEGLCDVTTEAICPEMLPPEQFQLSSSIRAAMFLVGGFVGYVAVLVTAHLHYSWLYFGYMLMMLLCGLPALALMPDGGEVARPTRLSQAACRTVDELFPAAGKVGALSAEVLDEDGERVPPLAVCGAVDQGGWPSGPCGTVRLWAQGTVGLLLRRAQLDAAVCPGTRAVAGPPLRVTRCDASALLRLDGRPPREALRSAFGAASAEDQLQLKGGGAMLALHSRQEEAGSPGPLRLLQGLRVSEDGTLPVEGRPRSGDELRLHAPDRFAAKAAVERASRVYAMERSGACAARPGGCFVFSDRAYSAELLEQDVAALAPQAACGFLGRGQLAPPGVTLGGSTAGTEDPDPDRTPGESFAVHRCSALVACLRFGQ